MSAAPAVAEPRAAWAEAFCRRMDEHAASPDATFESVWSEDLLRAFQHLAGFLPVQAWINDERIMHAYRTTRVIPPIARPWLPPHDIDALGAEDLSAIGAQARRRWTSHGWDERFGSLMGHLAFSVEAGGLHKSGAHYKKTRLRADALTRGGRGERLVALWSYGVMSVSHLRVFGIHPEPNEKGEPELLDNTQLVKAVREYVPLLAAAEREKDWPRLTLRRGARAPKASASDLLLWGLTVMLEPLVHNFELGRVLKKDDEVGLIDAAAFGRERWPAGPLEQMRGAFASMLSRLDAPEAEVEALLRRALSRAPRAWKAMGLCSPYAFAVDRGARVVEVLAGLGPLPLAELPFNLALEEVFVRLNASTGKVTRVEDYGFAFEESSPLHRIRKSKPGLRHYADALRPLFPALVEELA